MLIVALAAASLRNGMSKEIDPAGAPQIVLKFLHQSVEIVSAGPVTIDEMWPENGRMNAVFKRWWSPFFVWFGCRRG